MTDKNYHVCPHCKTKFSYFGPTPVIVDDSVPKGVIRYQNEDGTYRDIPLEAIINDPKLKEEQ